VSGLLNDPAVIQMYSACDFLAVCHQSTIMRGNQERKEQMNSSTVRAGCWQVTRNLNLNFGLAFEYEGQYTTARSSTIVCPANGVWSARSESGRPRTSLLKAFRHASDLVSSRRGEKLASSGDWLNFDTPAVVRFSKFPLAAASVCEKADRSGRQSQGTSQSRPGDRWLHHRQGQHFHTGNKISFGEPAFRPAYDLSYNLNVEK